jgi:peptide/nickel transport system substrate-binding protein
MRSIKWFLALALTFAVALGSLASAQRMGAWVDTIVATEEPDIDRGVLQLGIGVFDVYMDGVSRPDLKRLIDNDPGIDYIQAAGLYYELSFNPVGPVFPGGGLNPFSVPRIREAMNWLIDRNYVVQEIQGGLGVARWTAFNSAASDYARYIEVIRALELEYAYDLAKAEAVISEEMERLGATKVGGVWSYQGAPVVIKILIRSDSPERVEIGNYVASQLEAIGFQAEQNLRTAAEASPIWINGNPADGLFHIYTGGWITTVIPRDLGTNFAFFYTDTGLASPLWQAYVNDPEFYEVAQALDNNEFTTLDQRDEMISRALRLSLKDSVRLWLVDRLSIYPKRAESSLAGDLFAGIPGTPFWALTIRRGDEVGGRIDIAQPSMLTNPWNPLAGSNWIFDQSLIRATQDYGVITDPYTGLNRPHRIERADVVVRDDLPVGSTYDWVTLTTAPEIAVPADAWADWDAAAQRWITVGEKYPEGVTALRKSTVYYPADMYTSVTWHDGSPISAADFVLGMILTFDRGNAASFIYDAAAAPALTSFMSSFRGVRITSVNPLVIETFSDLYQLDAEQSITAWFPTYAFGPGPWHKLAVGILGESEEAFAFSSAKSDQLKVEQISYIAGPTISLLDRYLAQATASSFVPYANVMAPYVASGEAATRYANLAAWKARQGHYWVGSGVFYLDRAFPTESVVQLNRNPNYPDRADRWADFGEARIAEVEVDGPARVTIGDTATFEVFVSFRDEAYPSGDIAQVKYLVFDGTGSLATSGNATLVAEGVYEFDLDSGVTGALAVGSNRLEIAVTSTVVALPAFDSMEFVTVR